MGLFSPPDVVTLAFKNFNLNTDKVLYDGPESPQPVVQCSLDNKNPNHFGLSCNQSLGKVLYDELFELLSAGNPGTTPAVSQVRSLRL